MKRRVFHITTALAVLSVLCLFGVPEAMSQRNIANQHLNLQVLEVNKIDISLKAVRLLVDVSTIGLESLPNATNSDGFLMWTTNGSNKKITVATNRAVPRYGLRLIPRFDGASPMTATSEVVFNDNQPRDLIVGLSRAAGKCSIVLSATAPVAAGDGSDIHLITYTLTGI